MTCEEEPRMEECGDLLVERIRYFTGRHMAARDFHDADAYHRTHRYLHNRALHGTGVACGLEIKPDPRPECRGLRVVIRCGLALDCCGREVIVPADVVSARIPWDKRPTSAKDEEVVLVLGLSYRETRTEKVPVLYSREACASPSMEDGRVREGYEIGWLWVRRADLPKYGWDDPRGCAPPDESAHDAPKVPCPTANDPCGEDHEGCGCCVEPRCPPNHVVPLAVIVAESAEAFGKAPVIETRGRKSIAQSPEHLTRICWVSWEHGGLVKASTVGKLLVRFDRPLLVESFPLDHPGPRGINERTFVVQYGEQSQLGQIEDLDFVEFSRAPYLMSDRQTAVYELKKPFKSYRDHIIHVTLRCDFIVDCRDRAVDGNHLGGRLPTGDGVAGGTFESWFRVVDDAEYKEATQGSPSKESSP